MNGPIAATVTRLADQSRDRLLVEVQALRAIAVAAVVSYHFVPSWPPGGYIGVDVFYVISGFLITGLIVRALEAERFSFRDFYVRRARRLLPAATLVLAVTALAVLALPTPNWLANLEQILASLLYVQNWVLALTGSDYFANDGTAVQHYWSLSVEEQFYLLWPALLVGLWVWQKRRGSPGSRTKVLGGLALVSGVSLALGVVLAASNSTLAFYATFTRIWEFGAGAALAVLPRWKAHPGLRACVSWAGLAGLTISFLLISDQMAFPGWVAVVPVASTVAIIVAGLPNTQWAPSRLFRSPPVQWLGDISYSLYLWHWPPVVLLPIFLGRDLSALDRVGLLLLVLGVAWMSKVHIEDRFRYRRDASSSQEEQDITRVARDTRRTGVVVLAQTTIVVIASAVGIFSTNAQASAAARAAAALADEADEAAEVGPDEGAEGPATSRASPCFGAAALDDPGCSPPLGDAIVPDPSVALREFEDSADQQCLVDWQDDDVRACEYGDPEGSVHVALVGDSHALAWLPALERVVTDRGIRLTTYMRASCPVNAATKKGWSGEQARCDAWSAEVVDRLTADQSIDAIVTSAKNNKTWIPDGDLSPYETAVAGYVSAWSAWLESGKRVLAIKDTPRSYDGVLDCLASEEPAECSRSRQEATRVDKRSDSPEDPQVAAVERLASPGVVLADPVDQICGPRTCPAVIGNVIVFVDISHLSRTYSETLAPWLGRNLDLLLG